MASSETINWPKTPSAFGVSRAEFRLALRALWALPASGKSSSGRRILP
jgi:hypothetical protein